jgi:hypothetical protein
MGDAQPDDWRTCWEASPFAPQFQATPVGWVLETEAGQVVGSLGNVHMLYELRGQYLKAAVATAWAVDSAYRNSSMQLLHAFYRQKDVDLWLNGSASATVSQLLTALRIPRVPVPDYNMPLFWPVRRRNFANVILGRKRVPFANLLSYPAGMALLAKDIAHRVWRRTGAAAVSRVREFDGRFDRFWQRLRAGSTRLRAVRTRATLQWRFRSNLREASLTILLAERAGEIAGYAILTRRRGSDLEMELIDIADLQAIEDDPLILRELLLAAAQVAQEEGADAVKLMTGTPAKRAAAAALHPLSYRWPVWQLYCRTTPELGAALATADAWDFSLFDTF